jgi:type I restriction enzyme S subunit
MGMAGEEVWELPEGWDSAPLGRLVEIHSGFACSKKNLVPASMGVAHLRPFNVGIDGKVELSEVYYIPPDFKDNVEDYALEPGHILFNNTNSVELVGKGALVTQPMPCTFSNPMYRLALKERARNRLEPAWLALALRRLWAMGFFAERCNRWIGQAGFNATKLQEVEIPLPPLDEQRRIVARIEVLFERMAEARRLRVAADKDVEEVLMAALEQALDEVYAKSPDTLQLAEFASVFNGRASGSGESDVRVFKTRHVYPFDLKKTEPSYMKPEQAAKCPLDRYLQSDDVLVCNIARGTLGRACHVDRAEENWTVDTQIMILRVKDRGLGRWLFYYLYSRRGQAEILAREKGIAFADKRGQTHLYPREMQTVPVPLPPLPEQRRIVEYLDGVQVQVAELKRLQAASAAELERLEGAVLARAFKGE